MRTNASISRRHIGHDRSEWPQGTQVAKWPQGIQASRFSSVKHKTQGFNGNDSFVWFCKVVSIKDDLRFFVCLSPAVDAGVSVSFGIDSDDVDISTSVLLEGFIGDDEQAACSRA
jgi:hypothetical protein